MTTLLKSRLGINTEDLGGGSFKFTYPDGRNLIVKKENDVYIANGTRINNKSFTVSLDDGEESITERLKFIDNEINTTITKEEFISTVNDYSKLSNEFLLTRSPCDNHPSDESFDDCFAREFQEFCDGFLGCVALATNPVLISAVIAGHCAAC
jgi:hypothetical protein